MLLVLGGCEWVGQLFNRTSDAQGYWLPMTVELRFDPTVTEAALDYLDACRQAKSLPLADDLQRAFKKEIGMAFQQVRMGPSAAGAAPSPGMDAAVDLSIGLKELQLLITRQGDRSFPAGLTLGATAVLVDRTGEVVYSKNLRTELTQEVTTTQNNCEVGGLPALARGTAEKLAQGFKQHLGTAVKIRELAQKGQTPTERAVAAAGPAGLSFRVMVVDQNQDQTMTAGEEVIIQAEVTNAGSDSVRDVRLRIGGSGALAQQFKEPVVVGSLMPGQSKRLEVRGRAPAVTEPEETELVMSVLAGGSAAGASDEKRVRVPLQPAQRAGVDGGGEVEAIGGAFASRARQNAAAVVIGIGAYRDAAVPRLPSATADAELMARYFTAAIGVPAQRVRTLTDEGALKADLTETLEEWLPSQMKGGGVVFLYLAAQGRVDGGAVRLLTHETPHTAEGGYSLRRLYDSLAALPIQRAIVMLDLMLSGQGDPQWGPLPGPLRGGKVVQIVRVAPSSQPASGRHGEFTLAVLQGIRGRADQDGDRLVTLGELCRYVEGALGRTATTLRCFPPLPDKDKAGTFPLARLRSS